MMQIRIGRGQVTWHVGEPLARPLLEQSASVTTIRADGEEAALIMALLKKYQEAK